VSQPESPRQQAERESLERAVEDSPLKGKPLPTRFRLSRESVERYLSAAGGPFVYMRRLRAIEDEIARHTAELDAAWTELAHEEPIAFAERWRAAAADWSFGRVNRLIEQHNRYYPIESRLPMDPRTGDFARPKNGQPYPLAPLDAAWILERFPADAAAARAADAPQSDMDE
jgi:hypothetical protein